MAKKKDIRRETLIDWNRYSAEKPEVALTLIYEDAKSSFKKKCDWYWDSIRTKKTTSFWIRGFAFFFLVLGTTFPLIAAAFDTSEHRLYWTQSAIALLAVAGLFQLADKAFGWSSGWMRYITTATSMESAAATFELAWAKHVISKSGFPDSNDVPTLFALAEQFEQDLIKLQADETKGWFAEFNAGIGLLDAAIKTQREETQKQLEALRTASASAQAEARAQDKAKADADAAAKKALEPGVVQLALVFKGDPKPVSVQLDGAVVEAQLEGTSWSNRVPPGPHAVTVKSLDNPRQGEAASVTVKAGETARVEIRLPF